MKGGGIRPIGAGGPAGRFGGPWGQGECERDGEHSGGWGAVRGGSGGCEGGFGEGRGERDGNGRRKLGTRGRSGRSGCPGRGCV